MVFVVVVVFVYKYLSVVFSFEILIPKTQLRNTISMVWHVVQAKWVNVQTYMHISMKTYILKDTKNRNKPYTNGYSMCLSLYVSFG